MATPMEQFTTMVQNKTVSVIGIGVSNRPLVHMLCKAGAIVTARDKTRWSTRKNWKLWAFEL